MHPDPLQAAPSEPLSRRLRAAIQDVHQRIEATPIARAMAAGTVTRAWYGALIVQLIPVHAAAEERLAALGIEDVVDPRLVRRRAALQADRGALGIPAGRVSAATGALVAWLCAVDRPAALGMAYVIAGSSLGSQVLRPLLARALAVEDRPGAGIDAHRLDPAVLGPAWAASRARLDALGADEADGVVAGAVAGMSGLCACYAAVEEPR